MTKMKTVVQVTVYFNNELEAPETFDINNPESDIFENQGGYRIVDDTTRTTYFPYATVLKAVVRRSDVEV